MPARYASRVCREARLLPSLPLKLVDNAAAVPLAAPLSETTAIADDSALTLGEAIPLGFSLPPSLPANLGVIIPSLSST